VRSLVIDSGAFIAAQSYDPRLLAYIKAAERSDVSLYVSASVIAEVWRKPVPANAAKLLSQVTVVPLDIERAKHVGELLGATGTMQLVDAAVAALAVELVPSLVLTSDVADIERLVRAAGVTCNLRARGTSSVLADLV
jgi:predicted nucleic acid-binding protein